MEHRSRVSLTRLKRRRRVWAGPGRRHTTQQINRAYVVLLSSQFQGSCRDLHSECVNYLVAPITLVDLCEAVKADWTTNRQLDKGNAHQGTIAGDFGRLGVERFWSKVDAVNADNRQRRQVLDLMNHWRNAIAHQDFSDLTALGGSAVLGLKSVQHRPSTEIARAEPREDRPASPQRISNTRTSMTFVWVRPVRSRSPVASKKW
jgi:hypothetical protein